MSQENVDLVLRGIDALNRGDIEAALAPFHEDLEFLDVGTGHFDRSRREFGDFLRSWLSAWTHYHETPEEVLDLGDRVLVAVRAAGEGRRSGVVLDERHAEIHEFRDGLVARVTSYPTYEAAFEAAIL
jgi:ketosteroid isomerase-like protein